MHSDLRCSGSKTFSMITTLPSATDVTTLSPPTDFLTGTLKKKVTNPMKKVGIIARGYEMKEYGINVKIRTSSIMHTAHTTAIVP